MHFVFLHFGPRGGMFFNLFVPMPDGALIGCSLFLSWFSCAGNNSWDPSMNAALRSFRGHLLGSNAGTGKEAEMAGKHC